ncbi:ribosome biogenesis factor YjgA [Candidatus Thiodiazotropha sp. LNASS1]|uniref:ribosome biogenesis factor YjgA n=1 Tax=Candidatus Thiodiazotropha sp. LNASS1 TaxID=3096260 RepID=UPI00346F136F
MLALVQLGERLTTLPPTVLSRIPLSAALQEALEESRRIKSLNALRRHYRRLGKLLRTEDLDTIRRVIGEIDDRRQADVNLFHTLERWRERLLDEESEAFGEFMQVYPEADRQRLRQLIQATRREREQARPPASYRKLFKFLRDVAGI